MPFNYGNYGSLRNTTYFNQLLQMWRDRQAGYYDTTNPPTTWTATGPLPSRYTPPKVGSKEWADKFYGAMGVFQPKETQTPVVKPAAGALGNIATSDGGMSQTQLIPGLRPVPLMGRYLPSLGQQFNFGNPPPSHVPSAFIPGSQIPKNPLSPTQYADTGTGEDIIRKPVYDFSSLTNPNGGYGSEVDFLDPNFENGSKQWLDYNADKYAKEHGLDLSDPVQAKIAYENAAPYPQGMTMDEVTDFAIAEQLFNTYENNGQQLLTDANGNFIPKQYVAGSPEEQAARATQLFKLILDENGQPQFDENGDLKIERDAQGNPIIAFQSGTNGQTSLVNDEVGRENIAFKNPGDWATFAFGTGNQGLDFGNAGLTGPGLPNPINDIMKQIDDAMQETGGGGGGGGTLPPLEPPPGPGKPKWEETYHVVGAPDWWRGMTVVGGNMTPELEYALLMNSMIPFMSPEDQMSTAMNLYMLYPKVFENYSTAKADFMEAQGITGESPTGRLVNAPGKGIPYLGSEFTDEFRASMLSKERAIAMENTLRLAASKTVGGARKMGPGFRFLQQVAGTLRQFGGEDGRTPTRENINQMNAILDPLIGATESESLQAFGPVAKSLYSPFSSAGAILPVSKLESGEYQFGIPNRSFF